MCGRVLLWYGVYSIAVMLQVAKAVRHYLVLGLYSGIFIIYLHYNSSRKDVNKGSNIIFYALCLLYVLSSATFVFDTANFPLFMVSKNEHLAQPVLMNHAAPLAEYYSLLCSYWTYSICLQ